MLYNIKTTYFNIIIFYNICGADKRICLAKKTVKSVSSPFVLQTNAVALVRRKNTGLYQKNIFSLC